MPRLSTSDRTKARIVCWLSRLLAYANHELVDINVERFDHQIQTRWIDRETQTPKLIVQTKLRILAALAFSQKESHTAKEEIRHDLRVLKEFLGILEDNRTKAQGSENWHFTLNLWSTSTDKNLEALERQWRRCKSPQTELVDGNPSITTSMPAIDSASSPSQNVYPDEFIRENVSSASQAHPARETSPLSQTPLPRHNLPPRDYICFIGRQSQIRRLLELLNPHHPSARIGVEGIGGVGKTSLVLEVAYRCLSSSQEKNQLNSSTNLVELPQVDLPQFDLIIFTSAKPQRLTSRGILPYLRQERTLPQIFRSIAQTIACPDLLTADFTDQLEHIHTALTQQNTLLIVDNLDTVDMQQEVLSFLYNLPSTVKVLITSCERAMMDVSIGLESLPEQEGLRFIEHQAHLKLVNLSSDKMQTLYEATGGIPAAIVYAIGQLANGYPFEGVLPYLTLVDGDFCRFYFERSITPLRGQSAHRILIAAALFPKPVLRDAVAQIAMPDGDVTEGLARLHQLSLVTLEDGRCRMLPLTREYVLNELKTHTDIEQEMRQRWLNWSLGFVEQYGNLKWREWHEYRQLDTEWENIQAAIEWCIEHDDDITFSHFWRYVRGYTHLYGYWNERLIWMDWWMHRAWERSDATTLVQAACDRGWTFTLLGKPDYLTEAAQLFTQAWKLRHHVDPKDQLELAINQAILAIHQEQLEAAHDWLERSTDLLEQARLEAADHLRQLIRLEYYEAEVWCRKGNDEQAAILYHQVLQKTQIAQWQQVESYTLNWLAEIALRQQNLTEAELLLNRSLPIAQQHQDKRSIAFHKRAWAQLEQLRGNQTAFRHCTEEAKAYFKALGMDAEAQEMQNWLSENG